MLKNKNKRRKNVFLALNIVQLKEQKKTTTQNKQQNKLISLTLYKHLTTYKQNKKRKRKMYIIFNK